MVYWTLVSPSNTTNKALIMMLWTARKCCGPWVEHRRRLDGNSCGGSGGVWNVVWFPGELR